MVSDLDDEPRRNPMKELRDSELLLKLVAVV